MYKFSAVENNNEELTAKQYKVAKEPKKSGKKFRIDLQIERASLFMQFIILYNRNFKASIRNAVS